MAAREREHTTALTARRRRALVTRTRPVRFTPLGGPWLSPIEQPKRATTT